MLVIDLFIPLITIFSNICDFNCTAQKNNFDQYLINYNKNYTENEYWKRFDIYQTNINYIESHNSNNNSYQLGETPLQI